MSRDGVVVSGAAIWTAAGVGASALLERLCSGEGAFTDRPPYPVEGLAQPRAAVIEGLDRDRPAEALLLHVAREALAQAGLSPPPPGLGLIVGTSSGNLAGPWERWHRSVVAGDESASEQGAGRDGPSQALARALGLNGPLATISVACASGSAAFAPALGWLEDGRCEAVLLCGVDALCPFVHAGFAALGALSAHLPRPLSASRDGLLLGEGAAALLLERSSTARARGASVLARVAGVGLATDTWHMTAPDPQGHGVSAAILAALAEAGLPPEAVDGISLHATATPMNDTMEAQALRRVWPASLPPVHGLKGVIGHTLGAAGAIEAAVLVHALQTGELLPPLGELDPALGLHPRSPTSCAPRVLLSTSSAFGGVNASVVLTRPDGAEAPERRPRPVEAVDSQRVALPAGPIEWRELWPDGPARWLRLSRFVRLGLLAVRALAARQALDPTVGLVQASLMGCRATDLAYHARLLEGGNSAAHRSLFVHTIPGGPAAEIAMHWQLRGPALVFVGPVTQAEDEARRLIRWGRADRLIALEIEAPEPEGAGWARATLLGV